MTLFLVFLMLVLGLFALFLGGSLVAQGYLYQQPIERLPLRAVVAAVLVGGYVTLWVWIDQRVPGRYDTFFNFTAYSTAEFNEFEAVRWAGAGGKLKLDAAGNPIETVVTFKRAAPGKGDHFLEGGTGAPFELRGTTNTGGQYMTGALRVKGPDDPGPVRYNAKLKEDKTYPPERRFDEDKGSRYIEANQLGTLFVPSNRTVAVALLLNFLLVVVWVGAFWVVLRFSFGHSLMFAAALILVTMLALMPILFKPNRAPKTSPSPSGTPAALARSPAGHPS